jgi:hypothetical protein
MGIIKCKKLIDRLKAKEFSPLRALIVQIKSW